MAAAGTNGRTRESFSREWFACFLLCVFLFLQFAQPRAFATPQERNAEPQIKLDLAQLNEFQEIVRRGDSANISKKILFPLLVIDKRGGKRLIQNPDKFRKTFRQIFTPAVVRAIACQSFDDVFANSSGVMLGNGAVWMNLSNDAKIYMIYTINERAARSVQCNSRKA